MGFVGPVAVINFRVTIIRRAININIGAGKERRAQVSPVMGRGREKIINIFIFGTFQNRAAAAIVEILRVICAAMGAVKDEWKWVFG